MRITDATDEVSLIRELDNLRRDRENNRREFEEQWWNNIALVAGDHYLRWEPTISDFVQPRSEEYRIQLVLNQARVVARTELAKVVKARPIMEVIPKSMDEEDISAARVGNFVLEAAEWKFKLKKKRKLAAWWNTICGCAGIYVGYDGTDKKDGEFEILIDPMTNEPVISAARAQQLKQEAEESGEQLVIERYPMGDCEYRLYTPFQMLPDDTVLDFDDIKDLIVVDIVEVGKAQETWPDKAKELSPDQTLPGNLGRRALMRAGMTSASAAGGPAQDTLAVYTYWLPPNVYDTPFLRNGKMVRWTKNTVLLENDDFPYADKRIPFAFFTHTPNATSLWPDSIMTDIRPINLELDKTISQILENRDFMLNPGWIIPEQSQVRPIKYRPGMEIRYQALPNIPPPTPIQGTPMPTQIENLVIGLRDQILDISGQGEVSRGRMPSGVRSGVQIAYLQEEDETRLGPVAENFEDGIAMMGSLTLCRMGQYYHTERLLRSYKAGGAADVRRFKGADLKDNTDVVVQPGSSLPRMKAARQQFILTMAELGVEQDPKKIRDMLELGEGVPDEYDLASAQAQRENESMRRSGRESTQEMEAQVAETYAAIQAAGQNGGGAPTPEMPEGAPVAIPVMRWHIHGVHLKEHYGYMMTTEYEAQVNANPAVGRLFSEHTAMHEEEMARIQMEQAQMAQAMRGGSEGMTPPAEAQPASGVAEPTVG